MNEAKKNSIQGSTISDSSKTLPTQELGMSNHLLKKIGKYRGFVASFPITRVIMTTAFPKGTHITIINDILTLS